MSLIIPGSPITIQHPQEVISESEKFANGGAWFLNYARWVISQYYNTYRISQNQLNASSSGVVTATGGNLTTVATKSIVDEMKENYEYYNVDQKNLIFNHLTTSTSGATLPNIWIQGGEVRQLCDHILGKAIKQIEPIEKTISADSISENSLLKRKEVFDKIDLGAKIGDVLNELGGGDVRYNPAGNIDYSNPSAVKDAKAKIRAEYENSATVIARSVYYKNKMEEMFKNSVLDTILANLTGMEFKEQYGELCTNYIPGYCGIYDFSTWGEYGEGQTKAGYIVPVTLQEILTEYPNMNSNWVQEIEDVFYNDAEGSGKFMDYYNTPFTNVNMWYNSEKMMSKAVVYWLGRMDTRYKKKTTQFGGKKVQMIDDFKTYQIDTGSKDERGNRIFETKKGSDLKGDSAVWMVHKTVILGNKYMLEHGYDSYQVRPYGDKRKPEIPIKWLCQGKIAGYVKPVASRLRPKQAEIDAIRYRIREYVSSDMWVIFVNGSKLGESLSALDIVSDAKSLHVSVIPPTGDAETDKRGIDDIVKLVQPNITAVIQEYIFLKNDILREMQSIIGVTETSLGDQSTVIGKGVQQEAINRSELAGLNLYHSLNEYWRRCIQFGANKAKMIMMDQVDKNVVLPVSARETKILTLTKEFKYEDLLVYIEANDAIEANDRALLRQSLISYSIAPSVEAAEALLNILKMMKFHSFSEGIAMFSQYCDDKRRENEQKQMQEMAVNQSTLQQQQQSAQILQMQSEVAALTSKLQQIQLKGIMDIKTAEAKAGHEQISKLDDAVVEQISGLIKQQLDMVNQPQQQAQAS